MSSTQSRRTEYTQANKERLINEAKEILAQKEKEIIEYQKAVDDAEHKLAKLKAELKMKEDAFANDELSDEDSEKSDDSFENIELRQLKSEQDAEIQKIKMTHEEDMQRTQAIFAGHLKDAEDWYENHANAVYAEKQAELDNLRRELDGLKTTVNENKFAATQSRTQLYQQSKSLSIQNQQRIQELDAQLSELAAITREEIRDINGKIDECFVAIDVRERDHNNEIEKYQREIKKRQEKYDAHLAALSEQFANEKERLNQQLISATSKKENLEKVLEQLEKHHEAQLQATLNDIERMKSTIYQSQIRDDQTLNDTRTYLSQVQSIQRDCRRTEQEISLVNNEIEELTTENRQLQAELQKLSTAMAARNAKKK